MWAHLELRLKNLDRARKVMGMAIGKYPRPKIFRAYIKFEMHLGNVDRVRKLFEKYIECFNESVVPYLKFAV